MNSKSKLFFGFSVVALMAILFLVVLRTLSRQDFSLSEEKKWKPDFLVIGAMKAGSTALLSFIRQHPMIDMPKKEIHFFDKNFHLGREWYENAFKKAGIHASVIGEKSPYYLFHPEVPKRVFSLYPQIKIIAILRNPVDRAYSHYQHTVRKTTSESLTFEEAIKAEDFRLSGENEKFASDPFYVSSAHRQYSYLARGRYKEQLENWFFYFPRSQILVISATDLRLKPQEVMDEVFAFLELPSHLIADTAPEKKSSYAPKESSYASMSQETRGQLVDYFRPYNQELEELLGQSFGWD